LALSIGKRHANTSFFSLSAGIHLISIWPGGQNEPRRRTNLLGIDRPKRQFGGGQQLAFALNFSCMVILPH
jgi:hypothetical protein